MAPSTRGSRISTSPAAASIGECTKSCGPRPKTPPYPSPSPSRASFASSPDTKQAQLRGRARTAFDILHASHRGEYSGSSWVKLRHVRVDEYKALCTAVSAANLDFRHDFDPDKQVLVLRMPESLTHKIVKTRLANLLYDTVKTAIQTAVAEAVERDEQDVAKDLQVLSDSIEYSSEFDVVQPSTSDNTGIKKTPDIGFCYGEDIDPILVVEVAQSQKSVDLAPLARSYIDKSNGGIRVVITVDLDYMEEKQKAKKRRSAPNMSSSHTAIAGAPPPGCSCICLYRLGRRIMWNEVFRDPEGNKRDGELMLSLSDFVPESSRIRRELLEATPVIVPFSQLNDQLCRGEKRQLLFEEAKAGPDRGSRGRKRIRFDWDLPEGETQAETNQSASQARADQGFRAERVTASPNLSINGQSNVATNSAVHLSFLCHEFPPQEAFLGRNEPRSSHVHKDA